VGEFRVSMTALRQNLGHLVNRAAYGGDRIVLVSRGEPRAAIIGIEELRRLQQLDRGSAAQQDLYTQSLATADRLRERIQRWQEAHGIAPGDSAEDLRRLRERHDDELTGLR